MPADAQIATPTKSSKAATLRKVTPLFATPLFVYELKEFSELNRKIAEEAYTLRNDKPGVNRSNQHGWHSDPDFFQRTEPGLKQVGHYIVACVRDVIFRTAKLRPQSLKCEGWININPKGGYNVPHDHAGYLWSGTYYVSVPQAENSRSGNIEFLDPRSNIGANAQTTFQTKYRVAPHDGMLIVFPSYLNHWVYPNEQDQERITIAFNFSLPAVTPPDAAR